MKLLQKIAVILIDMQEISVRDLYPKDRKRIIPAQLEMIRLCAKRVIPLIILKLSRHGDIIPELMTEISKVSEKIILTRIGYSGFTNSSLEKYLRRMGTETIVIMGINANICVIETATEALKHGFKIASAKTLISGYQEEVDVDWYRKNGLFYNSHKNLIKKILK